MGDTHESPISLPKKHKHLEDCWVVEAEHGLFCVYGKFMDCPKKWYRYWNRKRRAWVDYEERTKYSLYAGALASVSALKRFAHHYRGVKAQPEGKDGAA